MRKSFVLIALSLVGLAFPAHATISGDPPKDPPKLKAPPISKELKNKMVVMEKLPPNRRPKPGLVKKGTKDRWIMGNTWKPGSTLRVAFNGGNPEWHKIVADTANEWSQYGNIKFDFGLDPSTGKYRQWSTDDTDYAAEIRIAFLNDGHWSNIGVDSAEAVKPNEQSMNLGFENEPEYRWRRVILHEFGHALGFGHEHQHPNGFCDNEFRWEDDPSYKVTWSYVGPDPDDIVYEDDADGNKPGLYTYMIGSPNKWSPTGLDQQMRQMTQESAFDQKFVPGPVDRKSIMHYGFDESFFKKGKQSPCHVVEADVISDVDKQGMAKNYPQGNSIEASE